MQTKNQNIYTKYKNIINIITFVIMIASAAISVGMYISMGMETQRHLIELEERFNKHLISDEQRFNDLKKGGTDVAIRLEAKVDLLLQIYGINPSSIQVNRGNTDEAYQYVVPLDSTLIGNIKRNIYNK